MTRVVGVVLAVMGGLVAVIALLLVALTLLGFGHITIRTPVAQRTEFDCTSCSSYPARLGRLTAICSRAATVRW